MTSGSTQTPLDGLSAFDGTGLNDLSVTVRKPSFDGCESHGLILLSFFFKPPEDFNTLLEAFDWEDLSGFPFAL